MSKLQWRSGVDACEIYSTGWDSEGSAVGCQLSWWWLLFERFLYRQCWGIVCYEWCSGRYWDEVCFVGVGGERVVREVMMLIIFRLVVFAL